MVLGILLRSVLIYLTWNLYFNNNYINFILWYNTYTITFNHLKYIIQWYCIPRRLRISLYILLYNHHHNRSLECFSWLPPKTSAHSSHSSSSFPIYTNASLLSLPIYLPVLDFSDKLNHIICGLCWVASYHTDFKFYMCYNVYKYFIIFNMKYSIV